MATSNSQNFSVTRDDILNGALRAMGTLYDGQTASVSRLTTASEALNMLVKQLQGKQDFAPGLKVWTRERGKLFLEKGKAVYTLGPNGDNATISSTETAMLVAGVATDTTVDVDSITGISNADSIGVVLDDGEVHFTTVNGAPSGNTVTITVALPSAAAIDNAVYVYTTKIQRPLEILFINIQDESGDDVLLNEMSLGHYERISDKDALGRPQQYLYEPLRTDGNLYLDFGADDVTDSLEITFLRPVDDLDAPTDELDYPQEWFRALKFALAVDLAPEYKLKDIQSLLILRDDALAIARNTNPDETDVFYQAEL